MGKSFKKMGDNLKNLIKDLNDDAHNSRSFRESRYNNMKITMNPQKDSRPHVTITIGMSEATYSLDTHNKIQGSLGPDDRYITRWLNRAGVKEELEKLWKEITDIKQK